MLRLSSAVLAVASVAGTTDPDAPGATGNASPGEERAPPPGGIGGSDAPPPPAGPAPRAARTGPPAPKLVTVLQGQSNAVFLQDGDGGYWNVYAPLVKALTKIPEHDAQAARSDFAKDGEGYTLASGTPTFSLADDRHELWLDPKGAGANEADPTTWPTGSHGTAFRSHLVKNVAGSAPDGVPVVVLRFHSEYDSTATNEEAKLYAAANRRFVAIAREAIGKPAAEVPVFFGMPGYWMRTRGEALEAIRDAWRADIADGAANCHWMFGNAYDGGDRGDGSHMDAATTRRAAGRAALAVSRWLFDNGYAHTDLTWLPRLGPRFVQVRRVPGTPNAIDAVVLHDKGRDLVIPPGVNLDPVSVRDGDVDRKVTGVTKPSPDVLRFTLDAPLSADDAKVRFDYALWPSYYGAGRLLRDDWSAARDAEDGARSLPELADVVLPLRRLDRALVLGAAPVSD